MSTIIYKRLETELTQEITVTSNQRILVAAIIPYLLVYNSPSGTFTLSVIRNAETVFSQDFTDNDIKASMGNLDDYAHVFFPIVPVNLLQLETGNYIIKLTASRYAVSESSFLGWCQQHEDVQNVLGYVPANDFENPLAIRIKVHK